MYGVSLIVCFALQHTHMLAHNEWQLGLNSICLNLLAACTQSGHTISGVAARSQQGNGLLEHTNGFITEPERGGK